MIEEVYKRKNTDRALNVQKWVLRILFLACVAAGFLCSGCSKHKKSEAEATPEIEVAAPLQDSVVVSNSYPAIIESASKADVVARVNGQLLRQHFQEGSYVTKGQLLFTIEPTLYAASQREAQAQVESARGQLAYATKHLAALEKAYQNDAVAEMDVIQARSAKEEAQASLMEAEASLKSASTQLGYCSVVAPVSGKISAATLDVGAYVGGGSAPVVLATIYNDSDLEATFSIPEYEYAAIMARDGGFGSDLYRSVPLVISTTGGDAEATSASSPRYLTDVVYESPAVEASTGNLSLKAKIKNPDGKLKAGMYGKMQLPVAAVKNGLLVRDASICTDQRGKYLYTLNDSDEIVYTPVTLGELYQDTLRLINSGLRPGQRYVTRAMISVRSGEKVKPKLVNTLTSSKAPAAKKNK